MEHANGTAIDLSAQTLSANPDALASLTGHEFFHLWNVKRIRPQSLEPVDYTRENYTRALWFSEGTTTTAANIILLRAGLLDENRYLKSIAAEIAELERRPAHRTQSVEESSLDAWLEKYDYYRLPTRSISYYNKGNLLGVLLDLQVREVRDDVSGPRVEHEEPSPGFPRERRSQREELVSARQQWRGCLGAVPEQDATPEINGVNARRLVHDEEHRWRGELDNHADRQRLELGIGGWRW